MKNHDFITVIDFPNRGNKLVKRTQTGIEKEPGPPLFDATARTVHVPDVEAMADVLRKVGDSPMVVICLGFFPDTEPQPGEDAGEQFNIASTSFLLERSDTAKENVLGWHVVDGHRYIARLKMNMLPSSWVYFDRDFMDGMPEHLARLDPDQWWAAMGEMIPGLDRVGRVVVPSTTGRVLVDGEPMAATGSHVYFQISDPYDNERFGATLLQKSFLHGSGFMRKWGGEASRQWSIFDPTTFSHERLVYEGKPTIDGQGLSVGPPVVMVTPGGRLDTATVKDLNPTETSQVAEATGCRIKNEIRKRLRMTVGGPKLVDVMVAVTIDEQQLQPDTEITAKISDKEEKITVLDYWKSDHEKLRCQTPFRDSTSWNGILNRHKGTCAPPLVFDNGSRIKFVLSDEHVAVHRVDVWLAKLERMETKEINKQWTNALKKFGPEEQEEIRQWVHKKTGTGLRILQSQLNIAKKEWQSTDASEKENLLRVEAATQDREVIEWDSADHERILPDILLGIKKDIKDPMVLTHGEGLVSVRSITPKTVRMVQKIQESTTEKYPPMMGIDRYDRVTLRLKAMEAIRFVQRGKDGLVPIEAPNNVLDSVLASHIRFPPLTGIAEHPLVLVDGRLLSTQGYDSTTGLFLHFPRHIIPRLPNDITRERAIQAYHYLATVLFDEFPFRSEIDRAGAVAMLITAAQRHLIGGAEGCPGYAIVAPNQSTGKTALARIVSLALLNRPVPASSWSPDDDEMGKRVLSILLEGHSLVVFDNLQEGEKITGNELAKAMTGDVYTSRLLGGNKWVSVPSCCTWIFTGNNITPSGDFNTRLITIGLDSREEHPDRRSFVRNNLSEWCADHRAEVLQALFILLVGGYQAITNNQFQMSTIIPTRFPEWDRMVRAPMLWAEAPDPAELFEKNKENDPMAEGRVNFLKAWHGCYNDTAITMQKVVQDVSSFPSSDFAELRDAITDISPNGNITSKILAGFTRRIENRPFHGLKIVSCDRGSNHKGESKKWQVLRL